MSTGKGWIPPLSLFIFVSLISVCFLIFSPVARFVQEVRERDVFEADGDVDGLTVVFKYLKQCLSVSSDHFQPDDCVLLLQAATRLLHSKPVYKHLNNLDKGSFKIFGDSLKSRNDRFLVVLPFPLSLFSDLCLLSESFYLAWLQS